MKKSIYPVLLILLTGCCLTTVAGAAEASGVDVHGFISQGYLASTDDIDFMVLETHEGMPEFNEMGLNFSARPSDFSSAFSDDLSLGVQFLAFDFGSLGNHEVKVDWAYGDYAFRDYLGVRAGIMKMPHGLYNETRKIDSLRPSIFLPTSVYPEWFREFMSRVEGVGIYGNLFDALSYQAQYGHVSVDPDGGLAGGLNELMEATGLLVTDMDADAAFTGSVQWETPLDGLKVGASTIRVDIETVDMAGNTGSSVPLPAYDPTGTTLLGLRPAPINLSGTLDFEPLESFVLSSEYQRNKLTVAAEYVQYDLEFVLTTTTDSDIMVLLSDPLFMASVAATDPNQAQSLGELYFLLTNPQKKKTTLEGYYGQVGYRLLDNLELGAYYSEFYLDNDEKGSSDWQDWLKDICLSIRYDINSNWCAKIEAHSMNGTFMARNDAAKHWELYAAKLSYLF